MGMDTGCTGLTAVEKLLQQPQSACHCVPTDFRAATTTGQQFDAVPTGNPGVGLVETARFGSTAIALRDFTKGTLVVREEPLLLTSWVHDELADRLSVQAPDVRPQLIHQLVSFIRASEEAQDKVLTSIYSPDPADPSLANTLLLKGIVKIAALAAKDSQLASALGASAADAEAKTFRVLLAWQSNGYDFHGGRTVLLAVGSKLAHTCSNPNTLYRSRGPTELHPDNDSDAADEGCFVATRDIAAGELITTSYLSRQARMQSTFARRHHLKQHLGFMCLCNRCSSEVDLQRGLPCPICSGDIRDSQGKIRLDMVPLKGVVYCDMKKLDAGDAAPWQCCSCSAMFSNKDPCLFGLPTHFNTDSDPEIEVIQLLQRVTAEMDNPTASIPQVKDHLHHVLGLVGPAHWATYRMYSFYAEMHAGELSKFMEPARKQTIYTMGLEAAVAGMRWHLEELTQSFYRIWSWTCTVSSTEEAGATWDSHFLLAAEQLLDVVEAQLAPTSLCKLGQVPLLEVQRDMAVLAAWLLERITPYMEMRRGWDLPHLLLPDLDFATKRCKCALALTVIGLQDALRAFHGKKSKSGGVKNGKPGKGCK